MSWREIGRETYKPPKAATATVLVTFKCNGCGALAVSGGNDPGKCWKDCYRR